MRATIRGDTGSHSVIVSGDLHQTFVPYASDGGGMDFTFDDGTMVNVFLDDCVSGCWLIQRTQEGTAEFTKLVAVDPDTLKLAEGDTEVAQLEGNFTTVRSIGTGGER